MKRSDKYVHLLTKKLTSKNQAWVDKKFISPDYLSLIILGAKKFEAVSLYDLLSYTQDKYNYNVNLDITGVNVDSSVETFVNSLKGKISDNVIKNLQTFLEPSSDLNDKSIASAIWATIINNEITNSNLENNDDLLDLFFYVAQNSSNKYEEIDLISEARSIFTDSSEFDLYLNILNASTLQPRNWYNFSTSPITTCDDEMVDDLEITNKEDMMKALKDFRNLPSVIDFVKSTYLQDKKGDGYCSSESIRDYKALALILNILKDEQFVNDPDFDKDNNIGLNIEIKLNHFEDIIKIENPQYKNSDVVSGFKNQSRKLANVVLGKDSTNVFGVWKNVIKGYIKKCNEVARKVKINEISPSVRKYLKTMGLIRDREVIKDNTKILAGIKNKVDDASKLLSYLSSKGIERLSSDPFIDNAEKIYLELISWAESVKNVYPKPLKLVQLDAEKLSPMLKEFVMVAKRQPANAVALKNKTFRAGSTEEQLSLFDDEVQSE